MDQLNRYIMPVAIERLEVRQHLAADVGLSAREVERVLAQAGSVALETQAIAVVDREGFALGIFARPGASEAAVTQALTRARTAAYFESRGEAFTTRTARFIIQDHFPEPIENTPGGPLYGVQFSSLPGSDVLTAGQVPAVSGDPGGVPLYRGGQPIGGIGVAGDLHDVAPRADLAMPGQAFYKGEEEADLDESVAMAGSRGFEAPVEIRSDQIYVEGLRLPFVASEAAVGVTVGLRKLIAAGRGELRDPGDPASVGASVVRSTAPAFSTVALGGGRGQFVPRSGGGPTTVVGSAELSRHEVKQMLARAVAQAMSIRAAIREPIGTPAVVHVAVVGLNGDVLGVFRMEDGTRFSYDVAVQKARTALFFSDDTHAITTRAIGFLAQRFYPPGINGQRRGPLFGLQNELSNPVNFKGVLRDGITIFPGGIPLYKAGKLVGAIGISGDGVDQDDMIAFAGARGFRPGEEIRSDTLSEADIVAFLQSRVDMLGAQYTLSGRLLARMRAALDAGLEDVRLPFVKFPRNPNL